MVVDDILPIINLIYLVGYFKALSLDNRSSKLKHSGAKPAVTFQFFFQIV